VVRDGSRVEAGSTNMPWEVGLVGHEFLRFSEVDECADASGEELVKFLSGSFKRRPWVLACE